MCCTFFSSSSSFLAAGALFRGAGHGSALLTPLDL